MPRLSVPKEPRFAKVPAEELFAEVVQWHEQHEQPFMRARVKHTGVWKAEDGAISGGQQPGSRLGAYLLSDEKFGDFELTLEARPDWPVDTGIMVRAHDLGVIGFQILCDHRPRGGIGGVFGNNVGNFLAAPFHVDGNKEPGFRVANLREGTGEPQFAKPTLSHAASFSDFAKVWQLNEWNRFRIRCVGALPLITVWVNDLKTCELDTSTISTPGYDPALVSHRLGTKGRIGFEVHDVPPNNPIGDDRWAPGAVCRWRNIQITEL